MAENYKLGREQWRLETDMNVPPIDTNFQFQTLMSRNIPPDTRNGLNDRQTSNNRPDIPPRPSSLKICSELTPDI